MRQHGHQIGFGTVEFSLVILLAVVVGLAGVLVYQRHDKTNMLKSTASTTSSLPSSQTERTAPTQPPATTTQYLAIKEWGIKLPLTDSIKDAYYVVATNSTDTLWLGLSSLDTSSCKASLGNTAGANAPIGAIVRVTSTELEPVQGKPYSQLYPGATVGNYYYAYISGTKGKSCASTATLQSIDSAFATASKNTVTATGPAN